MRGGMGAAEAAAPQQMEPIEIEVYEPVPERPGCLRHVRNRTVGEVWADLGKRLKMDGLFPEEYMGVVPVLSGSEEFPQCRWIACYAVTGGSEGHCIHVYAVKDGKYPPVLLGKTFQGMEFAASVATACARRPGA